MLWNRNSLDVENMERKVNMTEYRMCVCQFYNMNAKRHWRPAKVVWLWEDPLVYIHIFDGNIYGNMSKVIKVYYLMLFDFKEYFL